MHVLSLLFQVPTKRQSEVLNPGNVFPSLLRDMDPTTPSPSPATPLRSQKPAPTQRAHATRHARPGRPSRDPLRELLPSQIARSQTRRPFRLLPRVGPISRAGPLLDRRMEAHRRLPPHLLRVRPPLRGPASQPPPRPPLGRPGRPLPESTRPSQ